MKKKFIQYNTALRSIKINSYYEPYNLYQEASKLRARIYKSDSN